MFITFKTEENTEITIDITAVSSWDKESLVRYAADQLGCDYVDFKKPSKTTNRTITPINWKPLKDSYRQEMLTLKRPVRKFTVSL